MYTVVNHDGGDEDVLSSLRRMERDLRAGSDTPEERDLVYRHSGGMYVFKGPAGVGVIVSVPEGSMAEYLGVSFSPPVATTLNSDVHTGHCCLVHGCKYGNFECTVVTEKVQQEYPCEGCSDPRDPYEIMFAKCGFLGEPLLGTLAQLRITMSIALEIATGRAAPQDTPQLEAMSRVAYKYAKWVLTHAFSESFYFDSPVKNDAY